MNRILIISCSLIIGLFSLTASGEAKTEEEMRYLLGYMSDSGCIFIRNDVEYPGKEAAQHIQRKYNHMRNRTKTTEQVIKYAATESSFSGRPYMIKCSDGVPVTSADWLTDKLMQYRSQQATQN